MTDDLRDHPDWRPERAAWNADPWAVTLWAEPCWPGTDTFDDYVVAHRGQVTRLAVLDAVVNLAHPQPEITASWGLSVARRHFRAVRATPAQAMRAASLEMCDPSLRPRNRNAALTAAIADLHPDGHVDVAVCADSEVWVKTPAGWSSPWAVDMLTEKGRATWTAAVPADGSMPGPQVSALQERLLDDLDNWAFPYLGLVPEPQLRVARLSDVEEVIVATDGARLTAELCGDVRGWLARGLQLRSPGSRYPSPHGDVTVLHATLRRS